MDEADEGIGVIENGLATPVSNTDVIREVINEAVFGTSVIEDIDDTSEIMVDPNTEEVIEIIDLTDNDIAMTENFVDIPEQSTHGIGEIEEQVAEVKIEKKEATSMRKAENISEIMDQESEGRMMTEKSIFTPRQNTEGISETLDQIIEKLKAILASGREIVAEIMNLNEVSVIESVSIFDSKPKNINEVTEQATEGITVIENLETIAVPNTEKMSDIGDKTAENFGVSENLKTTPVSGTEVFTKIMDLDEVSMTETLAPTFESDTKGINQTLEQANEDISMIENTETTPAPNIERISEISDKIPESFDVNENSESISASITSVNETLVPNKNTINTVFGKEIRNMENDTETETSMTINGEDKKLNIAAYGREKKSLKRKSSHPSISEMVMDSIKSINRDNGVSFEDIKIHMEENYKVNVKALLKYNVNNFLQKWVANGILELVDEADMEERFKIKESENSYENNCMKQAKKLKRV